MAVITGTPDNDTLYGLAGNDTLYGSGGNDVIFGGLGNDVIFGGLGNDTLYGGSGIDIVDYSNATGGVTVNLTNQTATGADGNDIVFNDFEVVTGSGFNDFLTGSAIADTIFGGAGNDTIAGLAGDDTLTGGTGNDTLEGGTGNDVFDYSNGGGQGFDTITDFVHGTDSVLLGSNVVIGGLGTTVVILQDGTSITAANGHLWDPCDFIIDSTHHPAAVSITGVVTASNFSGTSIYAGTYVSTGDSSIVAGNIISGGYTSTGAGGKVDGNIFSGTYTTTGAISAITGANATVSGSVLSGSYVTTGYGSTISGAIAAVGPITLGSGSSQEVLSAALMGSEQSADLQRVGAAQAAFGAMGSGTALAATMGGTATQLVAGVYSAASLTTAAGTILTLDGQNLANQTWVFNITDVLAFGAGTQIVLMNAGAGAAVIWNSAAGYATVGASAQILGSIFAQSYISVGADAIITGTGGANYGLFAHTGYITLGAGAHVGIAGNTAAASFGLVTGTADAGSVVTIHSATSTLGTATANSAGNFSYELTAVNVTTLGQEANKTITASIIDTAGATVTSSAFTFNDNLGGTFGNDNLVGTAGDDTLSGGIGNDTLQGGAGNDLLIGGDGTDTFTVTYGERGTDTIADFTVGTDKIDLSRLNLHFSDLLINSSGGSTTLLLSGETIILPGVASVSASDFVGLAAEGPPTASGFDDLLIGGNGPDTLSGLAGSDTLYGGNGNDLLIGGLGNDLLYGGAGNDTIDYSGASGAVTVNLNSTVASGANGSDTLGGDIEAVVGSAFADSILGSTVNDVLFGAAGNDYLQGNAGDDTIYGGTGNDTLFGDTSAVAAGCEDTLYGGDGTDTLYGGDAGDLFYFNADNAIGSGTAATITLSDGTNNYTIASDSGITRNWSTDLFFGEFLVAGAALTAGNDTVFLTSGNDILLLNNNDLGIAGVTQAATPSQINSIEVIDAGAGNDIVDVNDVGASANTSAFTLIGGVGDDILSAGDGNDTVIGDLGADSGLGGNNDTLFGGAGNDIIFADDYGVSLGYGADGNDIVLAGLGNDIVYGAGGRDVLAGYLGNDTLYGGIGTDVLFGGADSDTVFGGDGDDFLYGGGETSDGGPNTLIGGLGNDWYYISRADGTNTIIEADPSRDNNMVLFGTYASSGTDEFTAGSGVHDTTDAATPLSVGYVLGSNNKTDGVDLSIVGTTATLTYASSGGNVVFDTGQIQTITLWNPDLTYGNHTQEVYNWNGTTFAFLNYI